MTPSIPARLAVMAVIAAAAAGIGISAASLVDPQQHGTRALVGLMAAATVVLCGVPPYGAWVGWCQRLAVQQR